MTGGADDSRESYANILSKNAKPTSDMNKHLRRRRNLKAQTNMHKPWEDPLKKDSITCQYRNFFGSLIDVILTLESKNITNGKGYLDFENIMVTRKDGDFYTRAWLLNRPEMNSPNEPAFRKQFETLVRMILHD
ncbi:unnamed protein product [Prunus armeniaca]|uniref:Uncharacterized protein n=1 Tax=Prunus armeniaca TaxID=36596 RepID=A0A6J5WNB0_PRUAR|nr:unnamed protein product [Prunus armeniaca]